MNGHFLLISSCTLFLQFFSELTTAAAGDTLIPTQFLSYNQTLVSSNKTFELGFFTPSNSDKWYLGIWYNKIPVHTVVWVANKDTPLYDSSGVLKIGNNGNLVLLNRMDSIIWSSTNHSAVVSNLVVCQLLDSGNLVVRYGNNNEPKSYIWQSFDYPSDTLFGGMKLGWDLKNGLNRHLTSWKSPSDPSPGIYTYEMDIRGSPQLVLRNGSVKLFRSGLWNGVRFIGTPELNNNPDFRPVFVSNDEEMYYKFDVENISVISRFILRPSGLLQRLTWNNRSQEWLVMLTVGNDQCDNYGLCGGYGTCNINNAPVCGCLQGFTPKSPQDYDQLNWSGGCIRRTPLSCNNRDGFRKFNALKLPDSSSSWVNKNMNLKDCEKLCLKNCSCTAYTNPDITGTMSSCVMWFGDLVDIRQLMAGRQSLYVRMAASELEVNGDSNKKKIWVVLIVSVAVIFGLLIAMRIIWNTRKKKKGNGDNNHDQGYPDESQTFELDLPVFDFVTIENATNNFSSNNILGEGGFGPVYKGVLSTGQEIAVKRLSKNSGQGQEEFKNEVILIAKLQHRNLVRLTGWCIQREENILIYEYMPNKSLDYLIFDQEKDTLLNWQTRFNIIVGIAQGLLYLHRDSRLRIIHRDLKAGNILLDDEMNPKISDFGMARTFERHQTEANTKRVVGTYGYMSPEYAIDGLFSMKSDVFSFGVLVLEVVSGKKNRGFDHPEHDLNLLGHAWKLWNDGQALEVMEKLKEDSLPVSEVLRCIQVGLLCVQQCPEDRPTMPSVVLMLGSKSAILPHPKQPGFYNERCLVEGGSSSEKKFCSSNEITISLIQGR